MKNDYLDPVVSVEWLHDHLDDNKLIILECISMPIHSKDDKGSLYSIIPHTRSFLLKDHFSDLESPYPNTMPSVQQFEQSAQKLGIENSSTIVVYDKKGIYLSPRAWWMFKSMGHQKVFVLNGGLPEWKKQGFSTVTRIQEQIKPGRFKANLQKKLIKSYDYILENTNTCEAQLIDARSTGRFNGTDLEPRANLKSGHIPHSFSLPYTSVLEEGKLKSPEDLKILFQDLQLTDQALIFSCGSGITACIILLASEMVLKNEKSIFDGSWTEWAERQGLTFKNI